MADQHTRRAKRHLVSWGTGIRQQQGESAAPGTSGALTVVLEDPDHLDPARKSGLVGPGGVVLAPGIESSPEDADHSAGPLLIGYEGSAALPGDELSIGDSFFIQSQEYAASQFMSVIGPTLIRITDQDDFAGYLTDADRARAEGFFPAFATDPVVRLADLTALGASPATDGPGTRLYVGTDGGVSTAPAGSQIGRVDDSSTDLTARWDELNATSSHPCSVCLGSVVPEAERTAALVERPWLDRYLAALDAIRELRARDVSGLHVSGFGGRLSPTTARPVDDGAPDATGTDTPLLLWNDDTAYVHVIASGRFFQIGTDAARLAETLLTHGDFDSAAAQVDRGTLTKVDTFFREAGVPLAPQPEAAP